MTLNSSRCRSWLPLKCIQALTVAYISVLNDSARDNVKSYYEQHYTLAKSDIQKKIIENISAVH